MSLGRNRLIADRNFIRIICDVCHDKIFVRSALEGLVENRRRIASGSSRVLATTVLFSRTLRAFLWQNVIPTESLVSPPPTGSVTIRLIVRILSVGGTFIGNRDRV